MIFSNLFHRKKNKESETGSFSQYDQSEYAKLETKNIVKELNLSDAAQAKKYVVDLCKQMIQASKDIEDSKSEYQLVTNYLTDIQILEDLTDAERKPILECATQVAKLEKQRTDFLKTKRRLTDTQFAQMQEEEENLPGVIRRLKANEADLDAIKRNMAYLEGKKLEWSMQRSDSAKVQKVTRTAACYLLAVFITLFAFVGILSWYLNRDLQLVFTIMGFAAVGAGAFILIRYQDSTREIRQADVNRNQAITLENRVKIRYVNTKNAVDFICEKYHVRNAKELEFLFGQYHTSAAVSDTAEDSAYNNPDHHWFYGMFPFPALPPDTVHIKIPVLSHCGHDTRVWLTHENALVDSREMVELKHELLTRRQKLRARMEYSVGSIHEMKGEALKNMSKLGNNAYQLEQIIRKIEAMNPVFK